MKIGDGSGSPAPRSRFEESASIDVQIRSFITSVCTGRTATCGALRLVAAPVEVPGPLVVAAVLVGLAEREQEVDLRLGVVAWRGGALLHLGDHCVVEAIGLEVGEAPVGLAEVRRLADAGVVRGDRGVVVADCLEDVAEPDQRAEVGRPDREAAAGKPRWLRA